MEAKKNCEVELDKSKKWKKVNRDKSLGLNGSKKVIRTHCSFTQSLEEDIVEILLIALGWETKKSCSCS